MTADIADLHLPIKPDGDVALFARPARRHRRRSARRPRLTSTRTRPASTEALARRRVLDLYDLVRRHGPRRRRRWRRSSPCSPRPTKAVTVYSQGVNQSSSGTDKVNAIINCHLATGRIGKPGHGPVLGHRPAQRHGRPRGRRHGQHARRPHGHRGCRASRPRAALLARADDRRRSRPEGGRHVPRRRRRAASRRSGSWRPTRSTSMPDADDVEAAIAACPFVVVSDVTGSDRHRAPRRMCGCPPPAWGEKDGTVTNSERRISRQRRFWRCPARRAPTGGSSARWRKRMGFGERLRLCVAGGRSLPSTPRCPRSRMMARATSTSARWRLSTSRNSTEMPPFQWPRPSGGGERRPHVRRGRFFTPTARPASSPSAPTAIAPAAPAFPLTLNTGRVRDHWHTMTRTGKSQRLSQHFAEPFVEIHPRRCGAPSHRRRRPRAHLDRARRRSRARACLAASAGRLDLRADALERSVRVARSRRCSGAGCHGSRSRGSRPRRISPRGSSGFVAAAYGFAVLRRKPRHIDAEYWAIAKCRGGWRVELGCATDRDWPRVRRRPGRR